MGLFSRFLLACNRNVEVIDKSRCNLREIPPEVLRNAKTLMELNLEVNNLTEIPPQFWKFTKLRYLNISDNGFRKLSSHVTSFVLLTHLDISRNEIRELPSEIDALVNLQFLDVSGNSMADGFVPKGLWKLRNLTKLLMNDICLVEIPDDVSNLRKLEHLEVRENFLKELPVTIGALTRLRLLDLGSNDLYELPYEIGDLVALKDLYLDDNELVELPKTIGGLKNLESLDVTQNDLEYFPDQLGNLTRLTELLLDNNEIENLPTSISHLRLLSRLKIIDNGLGAIPATWGYCTSLTEVFFTSNCLKEIPASIGNLVNLRTANFDQNSIKSIPDSIGKCAKLGVLSLRDNHVSEVPSSVESLSELCVFDLTNNRLEWLPLSIANLKNLKALWLSETQGSQSLPLLTAEMRGSRKVLTCALLPQKTGSMENLLAASMDSLHAEEFYRRQGHLDELGDDDSGMYDTGEMNMFERRGWKEDSFRSKEGGDPDVDQVQLRSGKNTRFDVAEDEAPKRESKVSFDANEIEVVDDDQLNQFTTELKRHHTPHPRELAARKEEGMVMGHRADSGRRRQETHIVLTNMSPQKQPHLSGAAASPPRSPSVPQNPNANPALRVNSPELPASSERGVGKVNSTTVSVDVTPVSLDHIAVRVDEGSNRGRAELDVRRNMSPTSVQNPGQKLPTPPVRGSGSRLSAAQIVQASNSHNKGPSELSGSEATSRQRDSELSDSSSNIDESDSDVGSNRAEKTVGFSDDVTLTTTTTSGIDAGDRDVEEESEENEEDRNPLQPGLGIESVVKLRRKTQPTREAAFLARRDTPHHKKGKRLVDEGKELTEEELQQILAGHYNQLSPNTASKQPYTLFSDQNKYEIEDRQFVCVVTRGAGVGFGITVAGGVGSDVPYRPGDDGIFLSNIIVNSPGFLAGLKVGDKILSVDGNDFSHIDHASAVDILRNSGVSITLTVERRLLNFVNESDNNSESLADDSQSLDVTKTSASFSPKSPFFAIDVKLRREMHQSFGFSFNSAVIQNEAGLKVTKIAPEGVAAKEGTLQIGDLIQKINEVDVTNGVEGRDSAVNILRSVLDVSLAVCRKSDIFKFPPPSTAKMERIPSPKPNGRPSSVNNSSSVRDNRVLLSSPSNSQEVSSSSSRLSQNIAPHIPPTVSPPSDNARDSEGEMGGNGEKDGVKLDHVEEVVLVKTGEPLGFSIKGGTDHPMFICGLQDTSVYVSKISEEGLASRSKLVVGDKILFANGINLNNLTHAEAVSAVISGNELNDTITLLVAHEHFLSGYQHVFLKKHSSELWGVSIAGGIGYKSANPYEEQDESIYVTGVVPFSPAHNCSLLQPGQRIIEMNNKSMVGVSYPEAKHELNSSKHTLRITVCDGFNSPSLPSPSPSSAKFPANQVAAPASSNHNHHPSVEASFYHMNKSISAIVEEEAKLNAATLSAISSQAQQGSAQFNGNIGYQRGRILPSQRR